MPAPKIHIMSRNRQKRVDILSSYYSFLVGDPKAPRSKWILYDIKIPAESPKEAILMDQFLKSGCNPNFKINELTVKYVYREIIEFRLVNSIGITRNNYRKIQAYSSNYIQDMF